MNDLNDNQNTSPDNETEKKKRNKKGVLIFFGVLLALLTALVLLSNIDFDALAERIKGKDESDDDVYNDEPAVTIDPVFFSEPDYDEDITLDAKYMKENRCLHYTYANETFEIIDRSYAADNVCRLFYDYFEAAKAGDNDAYYSLFTDDYVKGAGKKTFAPQKLYNINVKCFRSEVLTSGDSKGQLKGYTVYYCDVSYNIKDNNGTLRNDFYGDDATLPLVFEVIEKGNNVKISNIRRYTYSSSVAAETESPVSVTFFVWLAVFVVSAVLAVVTRKWFLVPHTAASFALVFLSLLIKSLLLQILIFALVTAAALVCFFVIRRVRSGKLQKN